MNRLILAPVMLFAHGVLAEDILTFVQADRLEYQSKHEDGLWDLQGWVGGDLHKFWWKTEGEFDGDAELQLLYSRAVSPFWDLQFGLRQDFDPDESYAVVGFQGLAPQWFEIDVAAFLSEDGDLTARIEAEYEWLLTQRLVLQPRAEVNVGEDDEFAIGLRLRYEIRRKLAPYIGISYRNTEIDDYASFVAGARFWF